MKNIELKARYRDTAKAREIAASLPAELLVDTTQTDLYFVSPQGRMKLRESDSEGDAILIWYNRPDVQEPRPSDFRLAFLPHPDKIREFFSSHFGVRGTVIKRRAVYLHDNIRINIDEVEGLGGFIEFEASVNEENEEQGRQQVMELMEHFGIGNDDLVAESYSDMLLKKAD